MIFTESPLAGAFVIDIEPVEDDRGFFARTFCREEFLAHGLQETFEQCNVSYNRLKGTLRGLHYQRPPHEEAKLVRVTAGAIFDVIVDLRPDSPTLGEYHGIELSAKNRRMFYIPCQFAHGFQTLEDDTEVHYQMGTSYVAGAEEGLRFDDATLAIPWPLATTAVSERDQRFPSFDPLNFTTAGR